MIAEASARRKALEESASNGLETEAPVLVGLLFAHAPEAADVGGESFGGDGLEDPDAGDRFTGVRIDHAGVGGFAVGGKPRSPSREDQKGTGESCANAVAGIHASSSSGFRSRETVVRWAGWRRREATA